jgi:NitT/TauT family transport system substrate-binding protein
MAGRPILLADASKTAFWVWLKAKYGFTDAQVRSYNYSLAPFLADKQAIVQGYLSSEPFQIEKEGGFKPAVFLLADEGYPGYANMLLAPDKVIADDPAMVLNFIAASVAGWKAYLHGDPAAADALILRDNPEMTPALLANAREQMRKYGIVESGDALKSGIGVMTDARWAEFFRVTAQQGVYAPDLDYRRAYAYVAA